MRKSNIYIYMMVNYAFYDLPMSKIPTRCYTNTNRTPILI